MLIVILIGISKNVTGILPFYHFNHSTVFNHLYSTAKWHGNSTIYQSNFIKRLFTVVTSLQITIDTSLFNNEIMTSITTNYMLNYL
jgi:hypothetical protein